MTNQERLDSISQRLATLDLLNRKIDKILKLLEGKKNSEPLTTFVKANNVENTFIEDRQREIFNSLDHKGGE